MASATTLPVGRRPTLTPPDHVKSKGYRADRRPIYAPINRRVTERAINLPIFSTKSLVELRQSLVLANEVHEELGLNEL